jgi:transcriptional regulator with XRE-family HTH domain
VEASRLADALQAPPAPESALARARVHRQLTREEAARRAGIREEEVHWLEEGRVYRFPSPDHALLATLLYASALGIDHREAQELAGRPVPPAPRKRNRWARRLVALAVAIVVAAVASAVFLAHRHAQATHAQSVAAARTRSTLPPPWAVDVVVLNGSGDINFTRSVASRIGALGYQIAKVARASRFDYPQTIVFFPPHGDAIALRLAKQLGVQTEPLPGGNDPRRLVVVVGPPRGPDG